MVDCGLMNGELTGDGLSLLEPEIEAVLVEEKQSPCKCAACLILKIL